jgi:hypothetical protein
LTWPLAKHETVIFVEAKTNSKTFLFRKIPEAEATTETTATESVKRKTVGADSATEEAVTESSPEKKQKVDTESSEVDTNGEAAVEVTA